MLIEFSVANFLSFKDKVTFSMLASSIKEHEDTNVFNSGKHKLLKSAAIYGANASGKSNLIKAMGFMRNFVINSSKETQAGEKINGILPFLLNTETTNQPSLFEIVFQLEDSIYRYGFELDGQIIHSEWLFARNKTKEYELFLRTNGVIQVTDKFKEGKGFENKIRNNALFLSVIAQFNGEISIVLLGWFTNLKVTLGLDETYFVGFTLHQVENPAEKKNIEEFLTLFDLGFSKLNIKSYPSELALGLEKTLDPSIREGLKNKQLVLKEISTSHPQYDNKNEYVGNIEFPLALLESVGSQKIFSMAGPLLNTFKHGIILVVDELDTSLHPLLTKKIIELFNSNDINKNNAQLIFATHDTNLLSNDLLRRDQIWFTEKNKYGATDLYSLVEFKKDGDKKVRNDASYEKDYILGKYGAIPFIGDTANILG